MDRDTDVLEPEAGLATEGEGAEPQTALPDHPAGETGDRQAQIDQALGEGEEAAVIDELAAIEGDLTVDDLRRLPGAEDLSDEELVAEWQRAQAEAETGAGAGSPVTAEKLDLPFPVYDAQGNKIDTANVKDFAQFARDLLTGKLQVGYNAMGREQRKTWNEVIRNAQQGHFNEQKFTTAQQERDFAMRNLAQVQAQVKAFESERAQLNAAMNGLLVGDAKPMQQLLAKYQQGLTSAGIVPQGYVPEAEARAGQAQLEQGVAFYHNTIVPAAMDIAKRYDANPQEILAAMRQMIEPELQWLTPQKLQSIIEYEIPALLERNGYSTGQPGGATSPVASPADARVAKLEQTVAALQKQTATSANDRTQQLRDKQRKAPPAGGGATPGAGDSMPAFKNRAQMKGWMQNDPDWAKL